AMRAYTQSVTAFGADHPRTYYAQRALGLVWLRFGSPAAARAQFAPVAAWAESLPPSHPDRYYSQMSLAFADLDLEDFAAAEQDLLRAGEAAVAAGGPDDFRKSVVMVSVGDLRWLRRDLAGAEAAYDECLRIRRKTRDEGHITIARCLMPLGGVQRDRGDRARARRSLEEAL